MDFDAWKSEQNLECNPNCGHAPVEHEAFDKGCYAGEMHPDSENPYHDPWLREIWFIGYSAGQTKRGIDYQYETVN